MNKGASFRSFILNAPYTVWSVLFIVIPLVMVAFYAFSENVQYYDIAFSYGGKTYECTVDYLDDDTSEKAKARALAEYGIDDTENVVFSRAEQKNKTGSFTLAHMKKVLTGTNGKAFLLSFLYSFIATVIALLLAYPFAYALSLSSVKAQKIQMLLVMLPMWMNMLIRTYSWMNILERQGLINKLLGVIGIKPLEMLGTPGAVILGMVYNYLPYMILPIYTVMSKIDKSLLEAADDLGCNFFQKFRRLVLPLSVPGIISGTIMVFVPSISTFFISQKMSNGKIKLVGDLIESQIKEQWATGGLNVGAAMSLVLMVVIFICTIITNKFSDDEGGTITV